MSNLYNDLLKSSTQDEFATEKVNVISNCLLGNYDQDGDYVIPNNIVEELVKARKVKKSVFKNSVFCGAFIPGYGEMVFEVTFQKNTVKDIAMSELYVLENEYKVNGYIQNTIRTKISSFTEKLDGFIENTYNHFHISLSDSDDKNVKEYKVTDEVIGENNAYILAKRNFNLNMAKLTKKEYNKLYKGYVTERLELLKSLNTPYALAILEKFNQEYTKIEKYFLQNDNYKAVSELLDKCIEDVQHVNPLFAKQEQEFMDKAQPIIDSFSKKAGEIASKATSRAMGELNKEDRQRNEDLERELLEKQTTAKKSTEPQKETPIPTTSAPAKNRLAEITKRLNKTTTESARETLDTSSVGNSTPGEDIVNLFRERDKGNPPAETSPTETHVTEEERTGSGREPGEKNTFSKLATTDGDDMDATNLGADVPASDEDHTNINDASDGSFRKVVTEDEFDVSSLDGRGM